MTLNGMTAIRFFSLMNEFIDFVIFVPLKYRKRVSNYKKINGNNSKYSKITIKNSEKNCY